MATDTTAMDLDSRCSCSTCKTRMSSLLHDSHLICVACRGRDCNLDNRCLSRQNTYLQNKKHTLTCQGGTGCYRFKYQPGSKLEGVGDPPSTAAQLSFFAQPRLSEHLSLPWWPAFVVC